MQRAFTSMWKRLSCIHPFKAMPSETPTLGPGTPLQPVLHRPTTLKSMPRYTERSILRWIIWITRYRIKQNMLQIHCIDPTQPGNKYYFGAQAHLAQIFPNPGSGPPLQHYYIGTKVHLNQPRFSQTHWPTRSPYSWAPEARNLHPTQPCNKYHSGAQTHLAQLKCNQPTNLKP